LRESYRLVRDHWWWVFGVLILTITLLTIVGLIVKLAVGFLPGLLALLLQTVFVAIVAIFYVCVIFMVYKDLFMLKGSQPF